MIEKSMFRLDGKVALITGAATGLGAGISVALASQGSEVREWISSSSLSPR